MFYYNIVFGSSEKEKCNYCQNKKLIEKLQGLEVWFLYKVFALKSQTSQCHYVVSLFILGQVWYLIVSIPDLCTLTYFVSF